MPTKNEDRKVILLTVDGIVVTTSENQLPKVILIRRRYPPFVDHLAIPGGFVKYGETTEHAVIREVEEEIGIKILETDLTLLGVYSKPERDPRGHNVTVAYFYRTSQTLSPKKGDEATAIEFIPFIEDVIQQEKLAFDHKEILLDAIMRFGVN
ncbi:MAG: NUDIX domain-containing protein [Candidatus Hodarchaeota archaeon]